MTSYDIPVNATTTRKDRIMDALKLITAAANTTEKAAARYREKIAGSLAAGVPVVNVATELHDLAHAEGALAVFRLAIELLDNGQDGADVYTQLVHTFLLRTDDTWSGRINDVRRSTADGYRDAIADVRLTLGR